MTFLTLAIVSVAALVGPLLALRRSWHIPVVIGELLIGIVIGASGFRLIDASDPTFTFLASIGFALIMFVAGSNVPVRDPDVRQALAGGAMRFALVSAVSVGAGTLIALVFHIAHAPLFAVLLASSSAALVLPIVSSLALTGRSVLAMTAQVAIADVACIIALPLVIDPSMVGTAALGMVVVAACAVALYFALRAGEASGLRRRIHRMSQKRRLALELRIDLAILFALAAVAAWSHISVMLAGFALGLVVASVGEPRRLTKQVFALADGFLGPLFFVWLGASLSLGGLVGNPSLILLGIALGAGALLVHLSARLVGQPVPLGLLSAAQLGIPVAAVTIGTELKVLSDGEAAAIILGALIAIAGSTVGASLAARSQAAVTSPAMNREDRRTHGS